MKRQILTILLLISTAYPLTLKDIADKYQSGKYDLHAYAMWLPTYRPVREKMYWQWLKDEWSVVAYTDLAKLGGTANKYETVKSKYELINGVWKYRWTDESKHIEITFDTIYLVEMDRVNSRLPTRKPPITTALPDPNMTVVMDPNEIIELFKELTK